MGDYYLSCCSTADLTKAHMKERGLHYISFHFELGGKEYLDDLGETIPPQRLFEEMINGAETKTSQISVGEYEAYFEAMLREGKDVLHVTLSSGISGTINSAMLAREALTGKYPDRKLYVVDSLAASSGYGLLMDGLADLRDSGMDIDTLYAWTEENKLKLHHWFFSSDLTFFIKGGRISKTAGFFGTMLNICPLLNVDYEGRLIPREKIRGKKKVIRQIVEKMKEHAKDGTAYSGKCYICHSICPEDAQKVAELVEENFPELNGKVQIYSIGATIGSHTGPGTVALFFWGDKRED